MDQIEREILGNYSYFVVAFRDKIDQAKREGNKAFQGDLSDALKISPQHISGIKKGKRNASIGLQEKIADFFGMSVIEFLEHGKELSEAGDVKPIEPEPPALPKKERRATDADPVAVITGVVTELQEAYAEINRLRSTIEAIGEGVVIIDKDRRYTYQNRKCREMFEMNLTGKKTSDVIPALDAVFVDNERPAVERCFDSLLEERSFFSIFGGRKHFSTVATPLINNLGELESVIMVFKDITDRQLLINRTRDALNALDRACTIYDQNNNIVFYNTQMKTLTGATDDDLVSLDSMISFLQRSGIITNLDEVLSGAGAAREKREPAKITTRHRDGTKYLYLMEPITTQGGREQFSGFMTTITPIKEVE